MRPTLRDVLDGVRGPLEITLPGFFVLAWAFGKLGDPTYWLKAPSVIAGTLSVPVTYAIGARTVGRAARLVGASIFAISPYAIFYGSEARAYALTGLLVALSTLLLLVALRRGGWPRWVAFGASVAASMSAHYIAAFPLAVQLAWALWYHRDRWRPLLLAATGAAVHPLDRGCSTAHVRRLASRAGPVGGCRGAGGAAGGRHRRGGVPRGGPGHRHGANLRGLHAPAVPGGRRLPQQPRRDRPAGAREQLLRSGPARARPASGAAGVPRGLQQRLDRPGADPDRPGALRHAGIGAGAGVGHRPAHGEAVAGLLGPPARPPGFRTPSVRRLHGGLGIWVAEEAPLDG